MKVVLLAPLPPPSGGIAGWTQRMLTADLKNGWTVEVVDEKLIGGRNGMGGGHKKNPLTEFQRSRQIWKKLKTKLKDPEARVVQACIPATIGAMIRETISAKITHKRGRKFITHFRCTVPNMVKSKPQVAILKVLVKNSDCLFCLNQQTIDYIRSINTQVECRYIPNFVDVTEMYQRTTYSGQISKIVYTGRVFESKGCKQIIDAARRCPSIQFELIGKVMIDTTDSPENVVFTGEKDKAFIREELKGADVFLFLTRFPGEGFSNSLAEAMAYSLPCIVTDWAANADMIGADGGVVMKNPSVDEVVNAIVRINDAVIRANMGAANYNKVTMDYNQENVTSQYVDAYESIL